MIKIAIVAVSLALTGCVSQSETALSNNIYKVDVDARGLIGIHEAKKQEQGRAAKLTLAKGYSHYLILGHQSQRGSEYAGTTPVYGQTNINMIGNTAYANTTIYGGQPINVPTSQTSMIVAMFHEADKPANAIDAAAMVAASLPK